MDFLFILRARHWSSVCLVPWICLLLLDFSSQPVLNSSNREKSMYRYSPFISLDAGPDKLFPTNLFSCNPTFQVCRNCLRTKYFSYTDIRLHMNCSWSPRHSGRSHMLIGPQPLGMVLMTRKSEDWDHSSVLRLSWSRFFLTTDFRETVTRGWADQMYCDVEIVHYRARAEKQPCDTSGVVFDVAGQGIDIRGLLRSLRGEGPCLKWYLFCQRKSLSLSFCHKATMVLSES